MNKEKYIAGHKAYMDLMHATTVKKNADYCGVSDDAFHNFKLVESLGITDAGTAIMVRMSDKMARISSFLNKGTLQVSDETVIDTCVDLANYAVILALYFEELSSQKATTVTSYEAGKVIPTNM